MKTKLLIIVLSKFQSFLCKISVHLFVRVGCVRVKLSGLFCFVQLIFFSQSDGSGIQRERERDCVGVDVCSAAGL